MRRYPINSSQIAQIGYSPAAKLLTVRFSSGALYEYDDVPAKVVADVMFADSPGTAFAQLVKGTKDAPLFHYRLIEKGAAGRTSEVGS